MSNTLTVELPFDLEEARLLLSMKLYEEGKVSLGHAADRTEDAEPPPTPEEIPHILDETRGTWGTEKTLDEIDQEIDAMRIDQEDGTRR